MGCLIRTTKSPHRPHRKVVCALGWIALVALASGTTAVAQQGTRIGYVDMETLLSEAPQIKAGRDAIDSEFRPRHQEIQADAQRLEELRQELERIPGDDQQARQALQQEIDNLSMLIERRREDLRQEMLYRNNQYTQRVESDIKAAVRAVARENNYDLVLSSPVLYADDSANLTARVLEYLRRQFERQSDDESQ